MRLFINIGTRDKLAKKYKEGGGFVSAEIMVTDDLGVPSGNAQKQWTELFQKEEKETAASPVPLLLPRPVKKIGNRQVYEF